jgi:hypothetical protein
MERKGDTMNASELIPAVLLWIDDSGAPVTADTNTAPHMLSGVEDAAAALRQGKPAMVAESDEAAVMQALAGAGVRE